MENADQNHDYITANCCRVKGEGLVSAHAYSIIGVVKLSNGEKLVQVRNPWGRGEWKGDWSDQSGNWTDELKTEAKFEEKVDGAFFISLSDYHSRFTATIISYDYSNFERASFLMLNDQDDETTRPGSHPKCGEKCTRHEFTLKSYEKQTVSVSASVWQAHEYPMDCRANATKGKKRHVLSVVGKGDTTWQSGTIKIPDFEMNSGEEVTVYVEMNYARRTEMARDFSVVAWGHTGTIEITHNDEIPSSSFPDLPLDPAFDNIP